MLLTMLGRWLMDEATVIGVDPKIEAIESKAEVGGKVGAGASVIIALVWVGALSNSEVVTERGLGVEALGVEALG